MACVEPVMVHWLMQVAYTYPLSLAGLSLRVWCRYLDLKSHASTGIRTQFENNQMPQRELDVAQCEERPLEVQWVVGSIPLGGPIKLFLVPASASQLV